MQQLRMVAIGALLAVVVAACAKEEGPSDAERAQEITTQGQQDLGTGDYAAAQAAFEEALTLDPTNLGARTGLGWSAAFRDQLESAAGAFRATLERAPDDLDAMAGLAFVERDRPGGNLQEVITLAERVLAQNPNYVYAPVPSVKADDLRVVIGQAAFRLGEASFPKVQEHVKRLLPELPLSPGDPATWVVEGTTYRTYAEALLKALELVSKRVSA